MANKKSLSKDFFVPDEFSDKVKIAYLAGATCALGSLGIRMNMLQDDGALEGEAAREVTEQFEIVRNQVKDSVPPHIAKEMPFLKKKKQLAAFDSQVSDWIETRQVTPNITITEGRWGDDTKISKEEGEDIVSMATQIVKEKTEGIVFVLAKKGEKGRGLVYSSGITGPEALMALAKAIGADVIEENNVFKKNHD